ncbi:gluconate 2-dehydrogenase subunit 3 family protein [Flavobacteriaceae bacterium F89]|uniref:Gluconate 2-dehydrogenase subunit 3 family protein n=1 Tax=Cerina litoralis TaxID=2874477 RepID=A0AAE3ET96_9FLAO|nr:gluconate 2-dehydrogenase subunit 3 family protein [Cerina litoralis]MCG2459157.1 gluconate 2-dehydrogenase subunit 3 family protein [Cerina litoralis]
MRRKEFLNRLTWIWGGAVLVPTAAMLQSCVYKPVKRVELTQTDIPFLDALGETIIPTTADAPGAKEAKIGEFMIVMVRDCMPPDHQDILLDGLNTLDEHCAKTYKSSFANLEVPKQLEIVQQLQSDAIAHGLKQKGKNTRTPHYFNILKGLTVRGYFTSKIGCTQARRYNPVPGKYEACIPYKKEDKIWAT